MDVTLFGGNLTQASSGVDETRSLGQGPRSYTLTDPVAEGGISREEERGTPTVSFC